MCSGRSALPVRFCVSSLQEERRGKGEAQPADVLHGADNTSARLKSGLEDNFKTNLEEIGREVVDWIQLAQGRRVQ
jgi:hypothetical protein